MEPDDNIDVKVGSCGGAGGIARVITENGFRLVVDATHPYATRISEHIRQGCEATGAEYIRLSRGGSGAYGSDIVEVASVKEAVDWLMDKEGNILAATGSNEILEYTRIPDYKERVTARVLSTMASMVKVTEAGFEGKNLVCAQGPFSEESNHALLVQTGARYMVTKDGGTVGGFDDKLRAARRAGAITVLVKRPDDRGLSYSETVRLLEDRLGLEHTEEVENPMDKRSIAIIGIGVGGDGLTVRSADRIARSDLVIGAARMLQSVDAAGKDTLEEYRSAEIVRYLADNPRYREVSVLMSGDVGFYSGAKKLLAAIDRGSFDVTVEPGISSLVYLCSKMETSWQDAYLTSSHGRDCNIVGVSRCHPKVFTLLSAQDSVREMCQLFVDYEMDVRITVGQDFGLPTERVVSGSPSEMLSKEYGDLCVALIENDKPDTSCPIGIPDEDFVRGDAPMTKSEIRALSVAKLKLSDDSVVYDVGAGTGSVSIEMALVAYNGKVFSIEKEDVAADLIEVNKKKFKTPNVTVIRGLAPEAMADLPTPTHAFIGGSSGNLKDIVACLLSKNPDIRIVINSVTIETMAETMDVIKDLKLVEEDVTCINVSRSRKLGRYHLMTAQNPVYIAVVRGR